MFGKTKDGCMMRRCAQAMLNFCCWIFELHSFLCVSFFQVVAGGGFGVRVFLCTLRTRSMSAARFDDMPISYCTWKLCGLKVTITCVADATIETSALINFGFIERLKEF